MSGVMWSDQMSVFGKGHKAPAGGLKDGTLLEAMREYRRSVAKRYRVLDAGTLERFLPDGKLWISTKLDGELWFLVKRGDDVALCAYNGRVLTGIGLVEEAAKKLSGVHDVLIAGELVAPPDSGRPRVHHVGAALASDGADRLHFHAFDLVQEGTESASQSPYEHRLGKLRGWLDGGDRVHVVTTVEGAKADALSYYREWVGTNRFEGVVLRGEQGFTYKVKPTFTIDAVLLAFGTRLATGTPQLREITVGLRRDDGTLHVLGSVGSGFSESDRTQWHERLSAMEVPSSFRMANRDGTLCRFVRPEIVVEIQCTDLIETDANDIPVSRMRLNYGEGGFSAAGDAPIAAMLFPTFLRERTDKVPDASNIGIDQITSRLSIDDAGPPRGLDDVAAEVLERKVYVKGEGAVRKYVLIDTHKGGTTYPPYVVYFTDYSAGRAEPLKTSMRPCSTDEGARKLIDAWLADNVKRGWAEPGAAPAPAAAPKPKAAKKAAEPGDAAEGDPAPADKPAKAPRKKKA